jgi:hypothetical protein
MSPNAQLYLSASIPSILVILSWIHNDTRLTRLETGMESGLDHLSKRVDETNKRTDGMITSFHNDMMSFQASILEAVFQIRERVTAVETKLK